MARRTRGSGSLGKRGGVWWIKYPDGFGHAYRESSHCKNKADAERLLKVRLGEVAAGKAHHPISRKTTVADVLQAVEQYYDDNGYSSTPQVRSRIKNHLLPFFGHRRVGDIGTEDLKRYQAKRLRERASRTEINREMEVFRRGWKLGLESVPSTVPQPLRFPMYPEKNTRTGFLDSEKYDELHRALPDYLKALFVVAANIPSRKGELTGLRWGQVDFDAEEIVLKPCTTKNGEGRHLPMFGPIKACLLMQRSICDQRFPDCEHVFFGQNGRPIADFRKAWASACEEAGVLGLLFHDLRRTAARNMRRAGIAENVIMKIAGWKTNSMFRRYDIVDHRDLRDASRQMEQFLADSRRHGLGTTLGTVDGCTPNTSSSQSTLKLLN